MPHHLLAARTGGRSSVGRAPPLQGGGQEFEPPRLHQPSSLAAIGPVAVDCDGHRQQGKRREREQYNTDEERDPRNRISESSLMTDLGPACNVRPISLTGTGRD